MKHISVTDADQKLPEYASCANISSTGSLAGMVKLYGWKKGHGVRIGSYIYHLTPAMLEKARRLEILKGE